MKKFLTLITFVCFSMINALAAVVTPVTDIDKAVADGTVLTICVGDKYLYGKSAQNCAMGDANEAVSPDNVVVGFKLEKVDEGYLFRAVTPDGGDYSLWGKNPCYLNSQPEATGVTFILGKDQDGANCSTWAFEADGSIKCVGNGAYFNGTAMSEAPVTASLVTIDGDPVVEPELEEVPVLSSLKSYVEDGTVLVLKIGDQFLYGSSAQNCAMGTLEEATAASNAVIGWKLDYETKGGKYMLRAITPAGGDYSLWGSNPCYLNSQPAADGVTFILGKNQDVKDGSAWTITEVEGGYAIQNIANGAYLNGTGLSAEPVVIKITTAALAAFEPYAVSAWADFKDGDIYTFTTKRGSLTLADGASQLSVTSDASTVNSEFMVFKGEENKVYLYSVNGTQYIVKSSNNAVLSAEPSQAWTIKNGGNEEYPIMIDAEDGNHWNLNGTPAITIDSWSTADDGNQFKVMAVATIDAALAIEMRAALTDQIAQAQLNKEYAAAVAAATAAYNAIDENGELGANLLTETTVFDNTCGDSAEGTDPKVLIDGNGSTFWHTDWHGACAENPHWLIVDLDNEISGTIQMTIVRRNIGSDQFTEMTVYGKDGDNWNKLGVLPFANPVAAETVKGVFNADKAYKSFKIVRTDGGKFWHAAEIQMNAVAVERTKVPVEAEALKALIDANVTNATQQDIDNLKAATATFNEAVANWTDTPVFDIVGTPFDISYTGQVYPDDAVKTFNFTGQWQGLEPSIRNYDPANDKKIHIEFAEPLTCGYNVPFKDANGSQQWNACGADQTGWTVMDIDVTQVMTEFYIQNTQTTANSFSITKSYVVKNDESQVPLTWAPGGWGPSVSVAGVTKGVATISSQWDGVRMSAPEAFLQDGNKTLRIYANSNLYDVEGAFQWCLTDVDGNASYPGINIINEHYAEFTTTTNIKSLYLQHTQTTAHTIDIAAITWDYKAPVLVSVTPAEGILGSIQNIAISAEGMVMPSSKEGADLTIKNAAGEVVSTITQDDLTAGVVLDEETYMPNGCNVTLSEAITAGGEYTLNIPAGAFYVGEEMEDNDAQTLSWTVVAGEYYIQNVESGLFFAGANNWGTRLSVANQGDLFNLTANQDGKYELVDRDLSSSAKALGTNLYTDNNGFNWTIEAVAGEKGVYTIKNDAGYIAQAAEAGKHIGYVAEQIAEVKGASKWYFLTKDEAVAKLAAATEKAPVDASFLLGNANFSRNHNQGAWTVEASNKNLAGGNNDNMCGESWRSAFNIRQTINVPNGVYELNAQATLTDYTNAYDGNEYPVVYANDENSAFNSMIASDRATDMTTLSNSFTNGLYSVSPVFVQVTDGTLTVGIKGTRTDTWCIWDNFQVKYYGADANLNDVKFAQYRDALAQLKAEAEAIEGKMGNAEASDLAEAKAVEPVETVEAYTAAIAKLSSAITAAKKSVKTYANSKIMIALALANAEAAGVDISKEVEAYEAAYNAGTLAEETTAVDAALKAAVKTLVVEDGALVEGIIVNPSFETGDMTGWTATGLHAATNKNFGMLTGNIFVENWTAGPGTLANETMSQAITLNAGRYVLTCEAQFLQQGDANVVPGGFFLFAGDVKAEISNNAGTFAVYFDVTEKSSVEIGAKIESATGNWASIDNFQLYQLPDLVYATPGEGELTEISKIEFTYGFGKTISPTLSPNANITVTNANAEVVATITQRDLLKALEENCLSEENTINKINVVLAEAITTPGAYTINIPAKAFYLGHSVIMNEAVSFTYNISGSVKGETDAINAIAGNAKDGKFMKNGKVVIVRNGKTYNVAGQIVK